MSIAPFAATRLHDLTGATLIVGSALSLDQVPPGATVSRLIFQRLFAYSNLAPTEYLPYLETTPFEQILNYHPFESDVDAILREAYGVRGTNAFHDAIAALAAGGQIAAIITTNYDQCIETALERRGWPHDVIVTHDDLRRATKLPVFKIHGSAERTDAPLVFNLRHEGVLPDWKHALLEALCADRPVYVVGYSGRDFDVCPVLFSVARNSLFWLHRPAGDGTVLLDDLSANLRFGVLHPDQLPALRHVAGDFGHAFSEPTTTLKAAAIGSVIDRLFAKEAQHIENFQLWAAKLFWTISCRTVAENVLAQCAVTTSNRIDLLQLTSDLEERAGRYLTSSRKLDEVASARINNHDWDEALRVLLLRCWRLYTGMYFGRLSFAIARVLLFAALLRLRRRMHDRSLASARLSYLFILLLSLAAQFPPFRKLLGWGPLGKSLSRLAGAAMDVFRQKGLWQEFNLMGNELSHFSLNPRTQTPLVFLPAAYAFSQLGNLVGESAAYRRERRRDLERCMHILTGLVAYGHHPKFWKAWFDFRKDLSPAEIGRLRARARVAYRCCEYGLLAYLINRRQLRALGLGFGRRTRRFLALTVRRFIR